MLNYRHLFCFRAIAKEGGFARGLHMPIQSVCVQVRKLHKSLGHQLRKQCDCVGGKPNPQKIPSTQFQPRHDLIQIDGMAIAVKGLVPIQVNMAPCRRRSFLE